jgi:hypothetical protein
MDKGSSQDFGLPEDFDIEEITNTSDEEEETVVIAGVVETWERLQVEKAKTRPYITGTVIVVWIICTIAGLIRWGTAGDISLLISSPVLLIFPLRQVLSFYFKE